MTLEGKTILVTGGSSGYGYGIAKILKTRGATIWITGRNRDRLAKAAAELGVQTVCADVAKPADWDRTLAETGPLDVLVNNAGSGGTIAPVADQTDEAIVDTIQTNLIGAMLGCRRVAKTMAARPRPVPPGSSGLNARDRAYADLRYRILTGRLAPGTTLISLLSPALRPDLLTALAERGVTVTLEGLVFEDVVRAAQVSRTSAYRRWPTRGRRTPSPTSRSSWRRPWRR